jgi:ribosomal protein L13
MEPAPRANPFFSFRYSYTEISASGGKARVKSRRASFEDGKLTSESFEGEMERSAYERMVSEAQRQFLAQTALLMKSLSRLLPFSGKPSSRPRLSE